MDEKMRLESMCRDLEAKAALDADATVVLLEALAAVFAGSKPEEATAGVPAMTTGLTPLALAREAEALRGYGRPAIGELIALRDSLYRYQSLVGRRQKG